MNTVPPHLHGPLIHLTSSPYLLEDFPDDLLVTHFIFEVECSHNLKCVLQLPFVLEADASLLLNMIYVSHTIKVIRCERNQIEKNKQTINDNNNNQDLIAHTVIRPLNRSAQEIKMSRVQIVVMLVVCRLIWD